MSISLSTLRFSFCKQAFHTNGSVAGKHPGSEWGKAYRHAFEALPQWCAKRLGFFLEADQQMRTCRQDLTWFG